MLKTRADHIIERVAGSSLLHVGCADVRGDDESPPVHSSQWVHRRLLDAFPDVWGLDASAHAIDSLTAAGIPNVHLGDAESFELDRTFDTIVAGEVIEHLGNPRDFLVSAAKHLSGSGRLIVTTPFAYGLAHILYAWMNFPKTSENPTHRVVFCVSTLERLAADAGLRVAELELIEDYRLPDPESTGLYRWSRRVYPFLRALLPKRVRSNCILAVLVRA